MLYLFLLQYKFIHFVLFYLFANLIIYNLINEIFVHTYITGYFINSVLIYETSIELILELKKKKKKIHKN